MTSPFTTYNSNQRVVAIPVTPTVPVYLTTNVGGVTPLATLALSQNSLTASKVVSYLYYASFVAEITAAASAIEGDILLQFQNAAHAAVGGAIPAYTGTASYSGATAIASNTLFQPAYPVGAVLTVPATAVEIALQLNLYNAVGAWRIRFMAGWGIDAQNTATTGDIGGGGMTAQSATNPNAF